MSRDYLLYLEDIREGCEKLLRYTAGREFAEFTADERTFDAALLNFIVIGEAVKSIPDDVKGRHPDIEWRRIGRLRDLVVHHYFGVVPQILWDIIQTDVPELLRSVREILDADDPNRGGQPTAS